MAIGLTAGVVNAGPTSADASVTAELSTQLVLRLVDEDGERRVEGSVSHGHQQHRFVGWMALLDALEAIVEGRAPDGDR